MTDKLLSAARERGPLIVAHRGAASGNIPCNSIPAFDAAIAQGADMIELDVTGSLDGTLYCFHPGIEPAHLLSEKRISEMHDDEVSALRFVNTDNTPTQYPVSRLEEVLTHLKGRCFINIDKYPEHPEEIIALVRKLEMEEQILIKSSVDERIIDVTSRIAPDISFMAVLYEEDRVTDKLLALKEAGKLNYGGAELVFKDSSSEFATREYIDAMHEKGLITWANAIVFSYRSVLTAGHDDDVSVSLSPDLGWGWLMDLGYDFIQTDWPLALSLYKKSRGK